MSPAATTLRLGRLPAPERDDVGVLDEDEGIHDLVALPRRDELLLQLPDIAVIALREIDDARRLHVRAAVN